MLADAYLPSRRFLHRTDPRAKALLLLAVTVVSLTRTEPRVGGVLVCSLLVTGALAIGVREAFRPLKTMLPVLSFLVVLTPLFYREGAVIIAVGGWRYLTSRGASETLRFLFRLVSVAEAFYLFFRSTELDLVIATARWFGLPFAASLTVGLAIRLVPSTAALYGGVRDAHSLRRPEGSAARRGLRAEIRRALPAVTAVLVHSVKSIPVLSMALETRGVGRAGRRSSLVSLGSPWRMLLHLAAGAAILALPILTAALL